MECGVMYDNKMVQWINLPKELWLVIAKKLDTTLDVVRFRSICHLCRSLVPSPSSHTPRIPYLKYFLHQTKIYRIEPAPHHHLSTSTSTSSNKGWLIKLVQDYTSSKLFLFDLFDPKTYPSQEKTTQKVPSQEKTIQKVLNLMNVRFVELFEGYTLSHNYFRYQGGDFQYASRSGFKVILFRHHIIFALHSDRKVHVCNIGDKKTTIVMDDDDVYMDYDDIILHKEQIYVVDVNGTIFWINPLTLKLVQFSPKLYCCGRNKKHIWVKSDIKKKQLVEYDGSLYVVDLYINDKSYHKQHCYKVVFVKIYKLDQEWGKWFDVPDLGEALFVLGRDSNFSLLAQDYYGCQGNCIYLFSKGKAYCFNLQNSRCKPANSFWPCPTLFSPMIK